ncbi:MAG: tetratricopeptide repeat protein [Bryobacteraceae bacterium]|nr:tetratricopeptide repeat protein [Bryobacteraceae bacterium]
MERGEPLDAARRAVLALACSAVCLAAQNPLDEASAAFREKRYRQAARVLRGAVRVNPADPHLHNFLGTVYYLEGNLEAALKAWNQAGKPLIAGIAADPPPRTDPVLFDRVFTFAAGDVLRWQALRATDARLAALDVFPRRTFRLDARPDGRFDLVLSARERNGWQWLPALRGVVYQAVHPEYFNIGGQARNVTSMLRWDPQKRRAWVSFAGPWRGAPRYRYEVAFDGRDERWEFPSAEAFRLRRTAVRAMFSQAGGGWRWSSGGEFSHREYSSVSGHQLKHVLAVDRTLHRAPEHAFETGVHLSAETGRFWQGGSGGVFERVQAAASLGWGSFSARLGAGGVAGRIPFDEQFILGLERDNDLLMRAHIGTRDGRKGSAPMGRRYGLANFEYDKVLYGNGLLRVSLGPFLDTGTIDKDRQRWGPRRWLWDTGLQAKLSVAGVGFTAVYGKDLRSGNNAFYLMATRFTR